MPATWDSRRDDLQVRSLSFRASTLDVKGRSVEAVLATERPVEVLDPRTIEVIDEVLLMSGAELPKQLPLLDDHMRDGVATLLGSARQLRVNGDRLFGRVHVARGRPGSTEERAWSMIEQGHLTDVSIGYTYLSSVNVAPETTETVAGLTFTAGVRKLRVVTWWKPRELSLTLVGADEGAKLRGALEGMITAVGADEGPKLRGALDGKITDLAGATGLQRWTVASILTLPRREAVGCLAEAAGLSRRTITDILGG